MALIEVDQDQWVSLQRELAAAAPHRKFNDLVGSNPKTRQKFLQLIKEVNPNVPIPELDAAKPITEEVERVKQEFAEKQDKLNEQIAALKKAQEEKEEKESLKARESSVNETISGNRKRLREAGRTKEAIESIEKLMEDRGLVDYEAAEALFDRLNPETEEMTSPGDLGQSWNLFNSNDEGDDALLAKDKNSWKGWQKKEISKFLTEKRSGQLRV
jgi:hypothetical protein